MEEGNPHQHLEELVALYRRNGATRPYEHFEWYYRATKDEPITSWLLRDQDGQGVVGLCSVIRRPLSLDGDTLMAGVLGNLMVDSRYRKNMGGIQLVRRAQSLVSSGEIDVLLGMPNSMSLDLTLRLGFRSIGVWANHAYVHRSYRWLRSRIGMLGLVVCPFLDLTGHVVRVFRAGSVTGQPRFKVKEMYEEDVDGIPIGEWKGPEGRFFGAFSASFVRTRFLEFPSRKYRVFGILDSRSNDICGYVVLTSSSGSAQLLDCRTDRKRISVSRAISIVYHKLKVDVGMLSVPVLKGSRLSSDLVKEGSLRLPAFKHSNPACLVGYWRSGHPLATKFAKPGNWGIFLGFNDV